MLLFPSGHVKGYTHLTSLGLSLLSPSYVLIHLLMCCLYPYILPLPSSEVFLFLYPSFSSGTVCWWTASTGYVHLISDSLGTLVSWKRNLFIRRRTLLWRKVFMSVIRGWSFILFNFLSFNNIYLCFAYLLRIKSFSYHIYYLEIYINWLPLLTRVVPQ